MGVAPPSPLATEAASTPGGDRLSRGTGGLERGELKQALEERGVRRGDVLVFADEFVVSLVGRVLRVWAPVGEEIRQRLSLARDSARGALAVDPITGALEWRWLSRSGKERRERMRAYLRRGEEQPRELVGWIEQLAEGGVRAVVWDRSGAHLDQAVRRVAERRDLVLLAQPPASPELNPAERVIEVLRQASEGRVFRDLESKVAAVEAELDRLARDPEAVRTLTRWEWIHQAIRELPPE